MFVGLISRDTARVRQISATAVIELIGEQGRKTYRSLNFQNKLPLSDRWEMVISPGKRISVGL